MSKELKTVVESVATHGQAAGGEKAEAKTKFESQESLRNGAELIQYNSGQPKEVVKFYDPEDVKQAQQAWAQPYTGVMTTKANTYVVMQATNQGGWNQYQIGAPLKPVSLEEAGFFHVGGKYYVNDEGFYIKTKNKGLLLFTDFVMDVALITYHYLFDGDEQNVSVVVMVRDAINFEFSVEIPAKRWKKLLPMIVEKNPVCSLLTDEVPRAVEYFMQLSVLLLRRRKLPSRLVVDRWGWGPVKPDGTREFYHGGRQDCTSDKKLADDPMVSIGIGWSILEVGAQQVTLPMLLYGAASYMDALFTDAGFPLDFCIMLVGDSGFMKTSASKVLFNVFADSDKRVHSVRGTEAAMHALTEEAYDDILVVDDFNLEGGTAEVRQKMKNIQGLVRTYSDRAPREKFSSKKHAVGYHVRGGAVFTAETSMTGQIRSAELRYLKVVLNQPMDGRKLSLFQQNPAIMKSFWSGWIEYLQGSYGQVCSRIKAVFPTYRAVAPVSEPRLKDDFAHLMCTLDEVKKFVEISCGGQVDYEGYSTIIAELVNRQLDEVNQVEPYIRFLAELFSLMGNGQLRIAPDLDTYVNDLKSFAGYQDNDLYLMKCDVIYTDVIEAVKRRGDEIPLTVEDVKKKLKENGLLSCDKDGILKRASSRIKGRPRMLALRYQACLKKLEEIDC